MYNTNSAQVLPSAPAFDQYSNLNALQQQNIELEVRVSEIYQRVAKDCEEIKVEYPSILIESASIANLQQIERSLENSFDILCRIAIKIMQVASYLFAVTGVTFAIMALQASTHNHYFSRTVTLTFATISFSAFLGFHGCDTAAQFLTKQNRIWQQNRFNKAIDSGTQLKLLALKKWIDRTDLPDVANRLSNAIQDLRNLNSSQVKDKIDLLEGCKTKIVNLYDYKRNLNMETMPLLEQYLARPTRA